MLRESRHCVVCDAPLRSPHGAVADTDGYPSCHAIACRMVVNRRFEMDEAGFRLYLQRQAQEKARQAARAAASRLKHQSETGENAQAWRALHAFSRLPTGSAAERLHLLLPSGPRRTRALAPARRERYRAHVAAIAREAAAMTPGAPTAEIATAPPARSSSMPGQLCALCGGGCCTRGTDHAYLSASTLRRFMDAQPQLSPEQVVHAYLERVGAATQAGSCINHTRAGCSLPREMRSDICNRYACAALAQLEAAPQEQVVLVVRRAQDQWRRDDPVGDNAINAAALMRETGVLRMPLR